MKCRLLLFELRKKKETITNCVNERCLFTAELLCVLTFEKIYGVGIWELWTLWHSFFTFLNLFLGRARVKFIALTKTPKNSISVNGIRIDFFWFIMNPRFSKGELFFPSWPLASRGWYCRCRVTSHERSGNTARIVKTCGSVRKNCFPQHRQCFWIMKNAHHYIFAMHITFRSGLTWRFRDRGAGGVWGL